MRKFIDEDFLLTTDTAKWLYHDVAEKMPIIDYHCHINPQEIAEDRKFDSITDVWLGGDHYKWRQMRFGGVPEEVITGEVGKEDPKEKFKAFATILPNLIGNPMYHWSHLELQRVFDIHEPLNAKNADEIYDKCNEVLKNYSARKLMERFNVKAICTTDDPCDDLRWHKQIADDKTFDIKVLPTFRPDKAVNIEKEGFDSYIKQLGEVCGFEIKNVDDVIKALCARIDYFNQNGCLVSDHGIDYCMYEEPNMEKAQQAFEIAMKGERPSKELGDVYKTVVTIACAKKYKELNWVMQIHFGCLRNNNKPQFAKLGPDTGYDAINSQSGVENVAPLLNAFLENNGLPKVVLYSLNPIDNAALVTIAGCFQGDAIVGRVQHGSAWWFNDNLTGMQQQIIDLANTGMLGCFVGMLTDSRSFLSYPRHEYFRRILCDMIGNWVESGQYPNDKEQLAKLVADICFNNTNNFFGFNIQN